MWGLKIQIKNNSYPVEVYRIMINEARHHLDVRLKPKSDYIQIRQGETKTILPGELCRQQIYTFDASIRIYLITPFEEAYEIRYINTDRLNYYQSEPVGFEDKYYAAYSGISDINEAMRIADGGRLTKTEEEKAEEIPWREDEGILHILQLGRSFSTYSGLSWICIGE